MENDITTGRRQPWNKNKLIGQKPPLKLKEIWAIRVRLQLGKRTRDLAMFNLAIDSKLGGPSGDHHAAEDKAPGAVRTDGTDP